MNNFVACVGVSFVFALGACNSKPSDAGASSGAAASGSASPAASGASAKTKSPCSETAWKEPSGLFCFEPPPGFKAGEIEKNTNISEDDPEMRVYFKKPGEGGKPDLVIKVYWMPKRDADAALAIAGSMESDFKNNKGVEQGNFAGTHGKFVVYDDKDSPKSHKVRAIVKGKKHPYHCEANTYDTPLPAEVIAACKSLTPTDG
jgi:hypothetical protein